MHAPPRVGENASYYNAGGGGIPGGYPPAAAQPHPQYPPSQGHGMQYQGHIAPPPMQGHPPQGHMQPPIQQGYSGHTPPPPMGAYPGAMGGHPVGGYPQVHHHDEKNKHNDKKKVGRELNFNSL